MQLQKKRLEDSLHVLRAVEKDKPSEGFQRGELKRLFEQLAAKYDLPFYTVRNMYYKEVRNKTNNFEVQSIQQLHTASKPLTSFYRIGQILKVKITNIIDYGAFVETLDGNKIEGLIHVSEIRNEYVGSVHDYFTVGDIVEAKVKKIFSNQKIEFSTKELKLITHKQKVEQEEDAFGDIMHFLNGVVGVLSPKAKVKLKEVIQVHGVVKFTIAMMQAGKSFENDLGLILLEQIEKRIEDCL